MRASLPIHGLQSPLACVLSVLVLLLALPGAGHARGVVPADPMTAGSPPPDCSGATASVTELWPPDHRLVPVQITGVTAASGGPVTIAVTSVTQDEPLNGLGDGDTCPDATLGRRDGLRLRAERSGTGNGRVYSIVFTATDITGASCTDTVQVCVPHDQRPGHVCVNDGQTTNSLGTCLGSGAQVTTVQWSRTRSGGAMLEYSLAQPADVHLGIFDVAGRRLAQLVNAPQGAGTHRVTWEAVGVASGVYYARLQIGERVESQRLTFVR